MRLLSRSVLGAFDRAEDRPARNDNRTDTVQLRHSRGLHNPALSGIAARKHTRPPDPSRANTGGRAASGTHAVLPADCSLVTMSNRRIESSR